MKLLFTISLLILINTIHFAYPTTTQYYEDEDMIGNAVNLAGYQRMLTQRLAKCYLASMAKANTQIHLIQIANDIKKFEENYIKIKNLRLVSKPLKDIKHALDYWENYKAVLETPASPESIQQIMDMNTEMLDRCHQVVLSLEKYAKRLGDDSKTKNSYSELAHLTNISGRQRMLSQRILLYYLAHRLGMKNKKTIKILDESTTLYSTSLDQLTRSLENTPEIDYKLIRLVNDWRRLETLCKNLDELSDDEFNQIVSLGNLLLSEMDVITKMYENLIDKRVAFVILGNTINNAGRQRMLSQKMAKAYLAIELGIEKEKHKTEIYKSKTTFEKVLSELHVYSPSKEIKEAVEEVQFLWQDYATAITDFSNTKINSTQILQSNTELLRACNNVVLLLKVYAKTITDNDKLDIELVGLIDKAGKQRMLSQRMVLYCMASNWEGKTNNTDRYLHKTIQDYGNALEELQKHPRNTTEIKEKLAIVNTNWQKIHNACGSEDKKQNIIELSNTLLTDMNQVTSMYENIITTIIKEEAINKAGRQRMLTQRIALNCIAINMGLDANSRQIQLKKDILLFEKQLNDIQTFIADKTATESIITNWDEYKTIAASDLSDINQIEALLDANTPLLDNCESIVNAIRGEYNLTRDQELIQISGKQRMLSQRITLYILAYKKGIQPKKCKEIIADAIMKYKSALKTMNRAGINSPEVFDHLEKMETTINKLERFTTQLDYVDLYQVLMASDITLTEAESLTKIYEKLVMAREKRS